MKKKILSLILAICLIMPCMFVFSACGGGTSSGNISSMSKEELATTFKSVALNSWQQLGAGDPTVDETTSATALSIINISTMSVSANTLPNEMTEQNDDNTFYIKQSGATMMAYVYMLGEYYENEDFVVSDKVVSFNVTTLDPNSNETYSCVLSLLPKIYKEENRVTVEMFLHSTEMQTLTFKNVNSYYYFDIGFDFNDMKYLSFYFLNIQNNIKSNDETYEEFTEMCEDINGKCFGNVTVSDNFQNACREVFNNFVRQKEQGLTLTGNFDDEFNRYADRANKACQNMREARNN